VNYSKNSLAIEVLTKLVNEPASIAHPPSLATSSRRWGTNAFSNLLNQIIVRLRSIMLLLENYDLNDELIFSKKIDELVAIAIFFECLERITLSMNSLLLKN
jgi:hypothetical protein